MRHMVPRSEGEEGKTGESRGQPGRVPPRLAPHHQLNKPEGSLSRHHMSETMHAQLHS